jgi:arylformamidase
MSNLVLELAQKIEKGELILVDLSYDLYNGMPIYPGDPEYKHEYVSRGDKYGQATHSKVSMSVHSGTHMDAPLHFVPNGDSVEKFDVYSLLAYGAVLDLSYKQLGSPITTEDLRKFDPKVKQGRAVMLYTGFAARRGTQDFLYNWPYLSSSGADFLAERRVRVVGIEAQSIGGWWGRPGFNYPARTTRDEVVYVHHKLLSNGVLILEGVNNMDKVLNQCEGGEALFLFPAVKIRGAEGAPVRPVAVCEPMSV